MDLPEDKGTYVLIVSVTQMKRLEIGRLGTFDVVPGFYSYVGVRSMIITGTNVTANQEGVRIAGE